MLIGYGSVSATEDERDTALAGQIDTLLGAGVLPEDVYIDIVGEASSHSGLDSVLALLRAGDLLVVTGLHRLGRSAARLLPLSGKLCDRGVGLRVVGQGIDTRTDRGRADLVVLVTVLVDMERQAVTCDDGDISSQSRNHRVPLTAEQVRRAQRLCDAQEHVAARISDVLLSVPVMRRPVRSSMPPDTGEDHGEHCGLDLFDRHGCWGAPESY